MSDAKSKISEETWQNLRAELQNWYLDARRPLPWRTHPSLYATVVSEFMCQQTQVETVLPYFDRWMRQFPDFAALAEATEEAVLTAWSGLGYYARARNLHQLAQAISALGEPPQTPDAWRKLPGIGPYSAAAICSIAFHHPAAVVDGNVIRVLARLGAIETVFPGNQAAAKAIQPLANAFLDPARPGDHNQALMELGATVCLKHRPACLICPLRTHCRAQGEDLLGELPRIERRKTEKVIVHRLWWVCDDQILLHRLQEGSRRLANLVELPLWPDALPLKEVSLIARKFRGISNQRIEERFYRPAPIDAKTIDELITHSGELFFAPFTSLKTLPLSGPHRRWIIEIRRETP